MSASDDWMLTTLSSCAQLDSARPDGEGAMARRMVHLALADVNEET